MCKCNKKWEWNWCQFHFESRISLTAVVSKCPNSLCTQFSPLLDSMQGTNGGSADVLWFKSEKQIKKTIWNQMKDMEEGLLQRFLSKCQRRNSFCPYLATSSMLRGLAHCCATFLCSLDINTRSIYYQYWSYKRKWKGVIGQLLDAIDFGWGEVSILTPRAYHQRVPAHQGQW